MKKDSRTNNYWFAAIVVIGLQLISTSKCKAQNNAYALTNAIWPMTSETGEIKISVCWDNPSPQYQRYMNLVKQAVHDSWEKNSRVVFVGWDSTKNAKADVHLYIKDTIPNAIHLGTKLKNIHHAVVLNFDMETWNTACTDKERCIKVVAVHEFGHILGFAHEQNRKDCLFNNCLGKDQGDDGDWTLAPCDSSSVMNYCNFHYLNDGFLSALDKQALHGLYGYPPSESAKVQDFKLVYSSYVIDPEAKDEEISHGFKIYISGDAEQMGKVDHVLYYLDPNWFTRRQREIPVKRKDTNFGLGLSVWRSLHIVAFVFLKNGDQPLDEVVLHENLVFN